jgi:hypothetical protein
LKRAIIAGVIGASGLVAGVLIGTGIGSSTGPYDDWGCPRERLTTHTLELAGDEGVATQELAIANYLRFLDADGAIEAVDQYLAALDSPTEETYYDPTTGRIYIEGEVRAEFSVTELVGSGFAVTSVMFCSTPPDSGITSPGPTPSVEIPRTTPGG